MKVLERRTEPELMLDEAQARAYAEADFAAPHGHCVELLRARHSDLPERGRAVDLGCGPGDITLRVARVLPGWQIDGIDGSPAMLRFAREAAEREGVASRVRWHLTRLPAAPLPGPAPELIMSNSLLHHLEDPSVLWSTVLCQGDAGTRVFVMDLTRPASESDAEALVECYAAAEPEILRRDFFHSLCAAYRPEEVAEQLAAAGLDQLTTEVVSDRHLIVWGALV